MVTRQIKIFFLRWNENVKQKNDCFNDAHLYIQGMQLCQVIVYDRAISSFYGILPHTAVLETLMGCFSLPH